MTISLPPPSPLKKGTVFLLCQQPFLSIPEQPSFVRMREAAPARPLALRTSSLRPPQRPCNGAFCYELSPLEGSARGQGLQKRARPHFFFSSSRMAILSTPTPSPPAPSSAGHAELAWRVLISKAPSPNPTALLASPWRAPLLCSAYSHSTCRSSTPLVILGRVSSFPHSASKGLADAWL